MRSVNRGDSTLWVVWVLLLAATVGGFSLGIEGASASLSRASLSGTGLIVLAAFKIRLIGLHFMELRHAPWLLRGAFELCILIACGGFLSTYHLTP